MRKPISMLLCLGLLTGLGACGEDSHTSSEQPTATSLPTATKPEEATLPDGLSGSCEGSTLIPNNNLGSVALKTNGGNLDISIPSATDMMLVDIGYYVNIYSSSDHWTQVRIEYSQSDDTKTLSVLDMKDAKTTQVGTFDVDAENHNQLDVSVPTSLIHAGKGSKWNAALDENGKDIAFCPAEKNDRSTLE